MADYKDIAGRVRTTAGDGIVGEAQEILDLQQEKTQEQINADVQTDLADRYTKEETYSQEELNSLITTPDVNHVSVVATSGTTAVTDVLPVTGAADTVYRVGNWDGTQYDPTVYSLYAWNGTAYVCLAVRSFVGDVYDISANHPDGQGNPTAYADLAAALGTDGANVPSDIRSGGMSVKFIQNVPNSDNKYVQYRLMSNTFNTTVANWQGVDSDPTAGSDNLVKSGGVFKALEGNALVDRNLNFASSASSSFFNITALTNKVYACVKIDNISGTLKFKNSNYTDLAVYEFEDGVPFYCLIPANVSILWFSLDEELSSAVTAHIYITNNSVRARTNDNTNRIDTCEGNILNLQNIQDKILTGKNISVVGDSISTYNGYSIEGHSFYPTSSVDFVEKTWWYRLIKKTDGVLKENLSYSGAYVTNVSGNVSLLTYIEDAQTTDIMLLAGGQNDSGDNSIQIGVLDCTKETSELDDIKFADAYLHYVRIALSKATDVVCIITAKMKDSIANVIIDIARYYNLVYIDMRGKIMGFVATSHPNAQGMQMMSECVYSAFLAYTDMLSILKESENYTNGKVAIINDSISNIVKDVNNNFLFEGTKKFYDSQTLDLSTITLSRKTLVTGGNLVDHTSRLTTPLLRLGKYTNFAISKTGDYNFIYAFYKKNDDGTLTCNKYQAATGAAFTSVIRDGWEYLYITFLKNDGTTINVSDLSNFTVVCSSTYNIVEPQDVNTGLEKVDENGNGFPINDYSSYKQGSIGGVSTEKSEQIKPLGVIPGHTYAIKFSRRYASSINIMVSGWGDSNFSNNTTVKSWTLLPNPVIFTVQYGVNYITVAGIKTEGLTPSDMEALDIRIYDITPLAKLNYTAEKIATIVYSGSRYAQGMAIQNGYLFQAFSDGTVDIYAIDTMSIVQSSVQITTPTGESNPLHCNAIAFGDKYDSGDEFGVLWVAGNGIGTKMVGVRISRTSNDFTFTNVYELAAPSIDEAYKAVTQWFDFENKMMIQGAYNTNGTNSFGNYNMFIYSYQSLDGNTTFTLVNTTELGEYIYPVQDGKVNNGVLYFLYGGPNSDLMICAYNIVARKIVKYINLRVFSEIGADEEPQGIDVYKGQLYVSTTKGIYKIYM